MAGEKQFILIDQIRLSLETLVTKQNFNVIFFSGPEMAFEGDLMPATSRFKQQASDFLDTVGMSGETNPIPALEAAYAMNPDMIFFLTDGAFNGEVSYDDVLGTVRRLQRESTTKPMVTTFQFIDRDDKAEEVMQQIADETGGNYKYVDRNSLQ